MGIIYQESSDRRPSGLSREQIRTMFPPYHASYSPEVSPASRDGIYRIYYPVALFGGGEVRLPIRRLSFNPDQPQNDIGIALLMSSQVTHEVLDVLTKRMAERLRAYEAERGVRIDAVAGIAKLGYGLAARMSEELGQPEWIPVDSSPKLWYRPEFSSPASSITSADNSKMLWIDPYNLDRVMGKRVAVIDDAVNTGGSMAGAINLLRISGAEHVISAPLFTEGHDWEPVLSATGLEIPQDMVSIAHLPVFKPVDGGYEIMEGTG